MRLASVRFEKDDSLNRPRNLARPLQVIGSIMALAGKLVAIFDLMGCPS